MAVILSSTRRANLAGNLAAAGLVMTQDDMLAIDVLDRYERLASPEFAPSRE